MEGQVRVLVEVVFKIAREQGIRKPGEDMLCH